MSDSKLLSEAERLELWKAHSFTIDAHDRLSEAGRTGALTTEEQAHLAQARGLTLRLARDLQARLDEDKAAKALAHQVSER